MTTSNVPLGAWVPDVASVDSGAVADVINVFPKANGYGPVKGLQAVTGPMAAPCKGAIAVRLLSGDYVFYAGTAQYLYKFNPTTLAWDNVSGPSAPFSVPDDQYWSFAMFGQQLIAVAVGAPPMIMDVDVDPAFTNLGGSPPQAQFVQIVGSFVVLGGLVDFPKRIQWSAIEDPTGWTPGINYSDVQDFPDGGNVTGMAGGEFGVVLQESAIRQMVFAPGSPEVFQFSKIEDGRGAICPWSVIKVGPRVFFLNRDGFYVYTGDGSKSISSQAVTDWFVRNVDPSYIKKTLAIADITGSRIIFAFKSQNAADPNLLDAQLVYDFSINRWSKLEIGSRFWITAATPAVSIDTPPLGPLDIDVDIGAISLDSSIYAGGIPTVGLFDTLNVLNFLEGANLEATIETADAQISRPDRSFIRGVGLGSDATDFRSRVGAKENLSAAPAWTAESAPDTTRLAPARSSARYHRGKIRIPSGTDWTYVSSIDVDFDKEGYR